MRILFTLYLLKVCSFNIAIAGQLQSIALGYIDDADGHKSPPPSYHTEPADVDESPTPVGLVWDADEFISDRQNLPIDQSVPLRTAMENHQWQEKEPVELFHTIIHRLKTRNRNRGFSRKNFHEALLYGFPQLAKSLFFDKSFSSPLNEEAIKPMLDRLIDSTVAERPQLHKRYDETLTFICYHLKLADKTKILNLLVHYYQMELKNIMVRLGGVNEIGEIENRLDPEQISAMWNARSWVARVLYAHARQLQMGQVGRKQSEAAKVFAEDRLNVWYRLYVAPWINEGKKTGPSGDENEEDYINAVVG